MDGNNVTKHKYVEFIYSIAGSDGVILERTETPLHYIHGTDTDMFPKIERALNECVPGDCVQVSMTPEESYG